MKTVLSNKPLHTDALERLKAEVIVLSPFEAPTEELLALLPQVQGLILGTGLHVGPAILDLATKLEVVGRHGVGLDNVDVEAATERGIPVTYTPYGPTESTAEHALLLMLAAARRLSQLDRAVRASDFALRERYELLGHELEGMTLGVAGFGRIGRRVAAMCRDALHMQGRVFDPFVDPQEVTEWGAVHVEELIELASQVDILTIHTPLTAETRHLVDREVIQAMKPGTILINTSRGPVVEEGALVEALLDGHLGGAGLDVYDPQPPDPGNPLLQLDQVVLTPHVASFTHESRRRMGLTVVEDVLRALRGERPEFLANPQVWPRRRIPAS
jgi:D-3-phosphoglycerate dehydrogenase